jgi:hypothetical protein
MQGHPGSSRPLDKKRKTVDGSTSSSSSSVNATVRAKKAKKSTSPSETGETGKTEAQWPDYFKEVSVREGNSKLNPGTLPLSVIQGAFVVDPRIVVS